MRAAIHLKLVLRAVQRRIASSADIDALLWVMIIVFALVRPLSAFASNHLQSSDIRLDRGNGSTP